jgi:signal transduction histidine kinase
MNRFSHTTSTAKNARRPRAHLSARLRLTLWYTGLFVVTGAVLLTLNYFLVDHSLAKNPDEVRAAVANKLGVAPNEVRTVEHLETSDLDDRTLYRDVQRQIVDDHLNSLLTESGLALAAMALVALGLGWLIAGRVLRPIHQMTKTARRLSESNLHERIDLDGPDDELKELSDTFDAMLDRLETAFDAQRQFVADASHELRTPLSIIRAEVDVTLADPNATQVELRAMAETIRDATERTERLIDSLLVLARSDSGRLAAEPCDLAILVGAAAERAAAAADARELGLELALDPAIVEGDRELLARLVANLVDNAVLHNVDRGWISLETHTAGNRVHLRVANSGTRLDTERADQLFDRFRRMDDARNRGVPGFGLGLSIVAAVAHAHVGRVWADPLPDGGLALNVDLPAAAGERTNGTKISNPAVHA